MNQMMKEKNGGIFKMAINLFIAGSLLLPLASHAWGITPSAYLLENVKNGNIIKREMVLTRAPEQADVRSVYKISASGSGLKYFKLSQAQVVFEKGEKNKTFSFEIKPQNAKMGEYEVKIQVLIEDEVKDKIENEEPTEGNKLAVGLMGEVSFFVVTTEKRDFKIAKVTVEKNAKKDSQPILEILAVNDGNVIENIAVAELSFSQRGGLTATSSKKIVLEERGQVLPFTRNRLKLDPKQENFVLTAGQYAVSIVLKDSAEKIIYQKKDILYTVASQRAAEVKNNSVLKQIMSWPLNMARKIKIWWQKF